MSGLIRQSHIYLLRDPESKRPRYVGLTRARYRSPAEDLSRRLQGHQSPHGGGGTPEKALWIDGLRERGLRPTVHLLETVPILDGPAAEERWISYLRLRGESLVNAESRRIPTVRYPERKSFKMQLLERERGQSVESLIREGVEAGLSWETIAHDLGVTRGCLLNWLAILGGKVITTFTFHLPSDESDPEAGQ